MSRSKLNFIIDAAMLVVLLAIIWTGILIYTVLPPGIRGGQGLILWGMNRHQFGDIHMYLGIALLILTGLHLWLHWRWFAGKITEMIKTTNLKNVEKRRIHTLIIIFAIFVLAIASLFLAKTQVISDPGSHGGGHGQHRGRQIQQSNK